MSRRFLDTNIFVRYFTRDDEEKANRAKLLLERIERGEEKGETSPIVIFETVYTLERYYRIAKSRIREVLSPIIRLRGLRLPQKRLCIKALHLFAAKNIAFADAYNAVYLQSLGLSEIYTFDTDFDKLAGIRRVEP